MTDQPRFELFAFWRTSATYRVRVAMALKGLTAKETQVNLIAGGQHDPAFLAVNPMAAIPALIDRAPGARDTALTQSLAILEFLEEIAPTPAILPKDPYARARVRSLALAAGSRHAPLHHPARAQGAWHGGSGGRRSLEELADALPHHGPAEL